MAGTYKVEVAKGSIKSALGEGPHWVGGDKNELVYVDLFGECLIRYVPKTGESFKLNLGEGLNSSIIIPVHGKPNHYIISVGREIQLLEWNGVSEVAQSIKKLYEIDQHCPTNRLNDGKCDTKGRLWAGTLGWNPETKKLDSNKGALYSFDLNGRVNKHFNGVDVANGLAWSPDNTKFYYIDTYTYKIDAYDYDHETGVISNKRIAFDFKAEGIPGGPDGMAIDNKGNLWVAVFQSGKVYNIDPSKGKLLGEVEFPCTNITSVAFGGVNLDTLYVTTGTIFLTPEQAAEQPLAGSLFEVTNLPGGVKGLSAGEEYKGPI